MDPSQILDTYMVCDTSTDLINAVVTCEKQLKNIIIVSHNISNIPIGALIRNLELDGYIIINDLKNHDKNMYERIFEYDSEVHKNEPFDNMFNAKRVFMYSTQLPNNVKFLNDNAFAIINCNTMSYKVY